MADSALTLRLNSTGNWDALVTAKRQAEEMRMAMEDCRRVVEALGLSVGITGLAEFGKSIFEFTANIGRLAEQAHISTDAFQALSYAAKSAGLDQQSLAQGLEFLNKSMGLAAEGATKQNEAIADLGLDTAQLLAMPVEQQIEAISKAYVNASDKGRAWADVITLLGRNTAHMQQVMEQLASKGMAGLTQENAPWIISPEAIKQAEEAEVRWKQVEDRFVSAMAMGSMAMIDNPGQILSNAAHLRNFFYKDPDKDNPIQSAPGGTSDKPGDLDYPIQGAPDPADKIRAQMAATLAATPAMQAAHQALTKALLDEAGAYETLDQKAARLRGEATTDEAESKKQAAGNVADFAAQVKAVNLLTDASKLRAQANKDENEADQQYIKETIKQANEDIAVETKRGELIISNLEAEAQAHDKIMAVAMVGIEHDWNTTDNQKWEEKQMLLAGNVAWLTQYQGKLEAIASNPLNPVAVNQKAASASGKAGNAIAGAQGQLDGMGPAPTSFTQNFSADLTKLQNQWGTLQQSMASGLTGVINTGLTSVETNLEKLVMGTETWRKALLNIVTAIEGSVVSSFIQMGVKWVATQVMMAVEGKATAASSAAAMLPIAMAESEIWAGPAALATIASWGGAAIAAPELVLASIAATQGLAGFSEGGYTGKGGIVHEEEFVFSAPAVRNIGVGNLERAHNMAKNPSSAPSQAVGSGGSGGPHFHFHNDFNEAFRAAHKNRANEKYLVDTARRTSRKM